MALFRTVKIPRLKPFLLGECAILFVLCNWLSAAPQPGFNYQARLTDAIGNPISGTHALFFSLYQGGDASSADSGSLVYAESADLLVGATGLVSHVVGSGTLMGGSPLSARTFVFDGPVYLQVAIDTSANVILPRNRLENVPYAVNSALAAGAGQIVTDLIVAPGTSISTGDVVSLINGQVKPGSLYGGESVFSDSTFSSVYAAGLSNSQFVIAFQKSSGSNMTARVGTLNGNAISFGPESFVAPGSGSLRFTLLPLTANTVAMVYQATGGIDTAVIGTVSGENIVFGSANPLLQYYSGPIAAALSGEQLFIADGTRAQIVTVSGSMATAGPIFMGGGGGNAKSACALSSTKCVATFNSNAIVADISGTTITYGPPVGPLPGLVAAATAVSASQVALILDVPAVQLCEVSGTSITTGPVIGLGNIFTSIVSIRPLSGNSIVVAGKTIGSGVACVIGQIVGNSVSFSAPVGFNGTNVALANLAAQNFAVAYSEEGTLRGIAILGPEFNLAQRIGIAAADGTAGQSIPVVTDGVSNVHSNLVPGQVYYAGPDGALTNNRNYPKVGIAISPTNLLLQLN